MDTWATSSMSPQIVGQWLEDKELYDMVFPMSLHTQAHDIIRTWAFYTIVKSYHEFGIPPWKEIAISGWGIAGEGAGKISKSRGGGPMPPMEMIEKYSADAVRYWAASTGFGRDAVISEEKIAVGAKLVTKLWNVARFSERFLADYRVPAEPPAFTPTDRWLLSRTQRLIMHATELMRNYDYAAAKSETESFFWRELADNYLEMSKERLYDASNEMHEGARYTLYHVFMAVLKLFAPFLPYVTETIYQALFATNDGAKSIHNARWPQADEMLIDSWSEDAGELLVELATAVRRYKSEASISLGTELQRLQLATDDAGIAAMLREARADIKSVTRAREIEVSQSLDPGLEQIKSQGKVRVALYTE